MGYYINLSEISLEDYQTMLVNKYLIPSQIALREDIDTIFSTIKEHGIDNMEQLRLALSSKKKLKSFAESTGISEAYLTLLIRNINGFRQKPSKISDLPNTDEATIDALAAIGINNTLQLFDRILTPESRHNLADETGIHIDEIVRLARLSDLCRIKWVNHTFAYVLLKAGYESVEHVKSADYETLYADVTQLNAERQLYKAHIGLNDMKLCVESAGELSLDVIYRY